MLFMRRHSCLIHYKVLHVTGFQQKEETECLTKKESYEQREDKILGQLADEMWVHAFILLNFLVKYSSAEITIVMANPHYSL